MYQRLKSDVRKKGFMQKKNSVFSSIECVPKNVSLDSFNLKNKHWWRGDSKLINLSTNVIIFFSPSIQETTWHSRRFLKQIFTILIKIHGKTVLINFIFLKIFLLLIFINYNFRLTKQKGCLSSLTQFQTPCPRY